MIRMKDIIARRRPAPIDAAPGVSAPPPAPDPVSETSEVARDKEAADRLKAMQGRDAKPWRLPEPDWSPGRTAPQPQEAAQAPVRRNIWDLEPPAETPAAPPPRPEPAPLARAEVHKLSPAAARNKTRLLGFHGDDLTRDVFAARAAPAPTAAPRFPVGWLVVVDGPGRGASFTLLQGLSTIGRGTDQTVALDYGDTSISRYNHASIAYDEQDNLIYVGHGGKSNIVRLNDRPLLSTEELRDGDHLRIGKTTLRFVAFCGPEFNWGTDPVGQGEAP
ncbi:FHA domain-containing protein [Pseudooceanicola sp.]|uniref:FHA domain-containing protein n=1 Tax=Pseudooceanicola sp. TaxID=1914328 RepID=UPI004058D11E